MIDRNPWDEAELKFKSLMNLFFGAEECRTFLQRNPHTKIERCTNHELVHELQLTFLGLRNTTFDKFQSFKAMQSSNESLETFYSRLRELGLHCKQQKWEQDLVKDLHTKNEKF